MALPAGIFGSAFLLKVERGRSLSVIMGPARAFQL